MVRAIKTTASAIVSGAILLYSLAIPTFASTTIEISGNGASSTNTADVTTTQETTVVQNNVANITNNVNSAANTGNNTANSNTGGNTTIDTGNAEAKATVSNTANLNKADVNTCGTCAAGNVDVTISGNGSDSVNTANVSNDNKTSVFQDNLANIENNVKVDANTGNNTANSNTGGDVRITTGNATATADVSNLANANIASVGGGDGTGTISARIIGNGAGSINTIALTDTRSVTVVQDNIADISNDVDVKANTGDNVASSNTGGDVTIDTGNATANATIDNVANLNAADVICCVVDAIAKISGNGVNSVNTIITELGSELSIFQNGKDKKDNLANLTNTLDVEALSGTNVASGNTGPVLGDAVSVMTGNATQKTSVSNLVNANIFGPLTGLIMPPDLDLSFSFDLSKFLGFFGMV